jgi:hypothetical protein
MGLHNNGIIINASTSIWQQEMNGNQPSAQPRSMNPVDISTHSDGKIGNESISIQQEQSILTQKTVQPHSVIQHSQHEPPNIDSARVETAADNMTITSMHLLAFSKRKGLSLHQPRNNFPRMRICVSVKPQATIPHQRQILHHCTEQK